MKRPAYINAVEWIAEHYANRLDAVDILHPGPGAVAKIAQWPPVQMAADLWSVKADHVAENVLRLRAMRRAAR